ncbi:transcriptional regulator [Bosea minatitlanensis]|uniref:Transcriptional regulator n=1 Tax=Bosea minatitlanensis TaxID=128782 RepID=A0ABW0F601_9HYPH|nr:transcriptional regulator [Bosea minatitlanensis]MCT4494348.1 transcriptional regulator [Bosea minatitlanensis]
MSGTRLSLEETQLRAQSRATLAAQRRAEAETALEALRVEQAAIRERTARLRALRLAKEAADAAIAAASPPPAKRSVRGKRSTA